MIAKLVAAITPYLLWIALAFGLTVGGGLAWWFQSNRIERRDLRIERLESAISLAGQNAAAAARLSEATIAGLTSDLASAYRHQRIEYVEVIKELEPVTSPTAQCLTADAVGVLQRAQDRRDPEGPRPSVALEPGPRPPTDPVRPSGGASQRAVANWMAAAHKQYRDLQARDHAKSELLRSLPCVVVVPD